jgi:hypothetical protein
VTLAAHAHGSSALLAVFIAANIVIALGYAVLCAVWARLLSHARTRRSRWGMACTAAFFGGCVGTHVMAICEPHATVFWTAWHVVQAVGTWGAIVIGHLILRDAQAQWSQWSAGGGDHESTDSD